MTGKIDVTGKASVEYVLKCADTNHDGKIDVTGKTPIICDHAPPPPPPPPTHTHTLRTNQRERLGRMIFRVLQTMFFVLSFAIENLIECKKKPKTKTQKKRQFGENQNEIAPSFPVEPSVFRKWNEIPKVTK